MTSDLPNAGIDAALGRAGMLPAPPQVLAQLDAACAGVQGRGAAVLDVSRARWMTETREVDVLVVLTRTGLVLVSMRNGGLFKGPEPVCRTIPFADFSDVTEEDEYAGASVWFLPSPGFEPFLLSWPDMAERHRMYWAIFSAHRGRYQQWGLQLDPADYVADFERWHARIVAEGPTDGRECYRWAEQQVGVFDLANALGFAAEWRSCELEDAAAAEWSRRVSRIAFPFPWIDTGPEAARVVVRLGAHLFDEGLLGPPYDERSFDTDEPICDGDAGPSRLLALMTLAGHAHALGHPRAAEWVAAAREGVPAVPPTVFSESMRTLWSGIARLPAVDDSPPAEIPIWEDIDVRAISTPGAGRVVYSTDGLTAGDTALTNRFFSADQALRQAEAPDGESVERVCLLGVAAFEGLSTDAPTGWRKLVLYAVSDRTYDLLEKYELGGPAAKLAHWVVATIEANGWGPDGRTTPLGQHHSYATGVAVRAGVGILVIDPATGLASAPTGDEAREASAAGHF